MFGQLGGLACDAVRKQPSGGIGGWPPEDGRKHLAEDVSIAFDDPQLGIPWPLPVTLRSERDRLAPPLSGVANLLA